VHVECRRHRIGAADERLESVGNQLGDERARDQHVLVDVEAKVAEPGLVREVGGGNPLFNSPVEQMRELRALGLRQSGVEEGIQPVERQVQRMQQQIGRLVVGIGRAVAERQPALAEARHRVAQPVAQRHEVLRRGSGHRVVPGNSSRSRTPR